jgi:2-amino-4-hydroxy-6-hydroxymethyldihydropteridine diphosphokinase
VSSLPADVLVIGFGGNVGDDAAIIDRFRNARAAFAALGDLRSAPLYRTAAIGPEQPPFLNTATRVRVAGAIGEEIIATVLEIERLLGRDRRTESRWGPRRIDLDVLAWGERIIRTPDLEVPHPRLHERRFALAPMVALFGEDLVLPGMTESLGALERRARDQALDEISASW